MVSNAIDVELGELLATLQRIRREHADDPEYVQLRPTWPADWPM